jgi:hypothetical protein
MFFGGGTVTSGTVCEVGLDVMGHGPEMGWLVDDNKGEAAQEKGIEQKLNQSLKLLCSRFSLPTPTSPVAALHKRQYLPVAALHKRHYPPPHVPVTSGGHGVLQSPNRISE